MALVQSSAVSKTTGGANNTVTLNGVVAGNLLIVTGSWAQITNSTPPTLAGWTLAEAPTGQLLTIGGAWAGSVIYYRKNAMSGTHSMTAVPVGGSAGLTFQMHEFDSSIGLTEPLDVHTNSAGSGTSGNSGTTGATTVANELVITVMGLADNNGVPHASIGLNDPATTGYTSLGVNNNTTDNSIAYQASYKYVTATGAQTGSWTWTDSSAYVGTIATFLYAATGIPTFLIDA